MKRNILIIGLIILYAGINKSLGQPVVIDKIIATVGNKIILKSDLENQYVQYLAQNNDVSGNERCEILQHMILNKMLLNQAAEDSVTISDDQIDSELDKRIRYFVSQLGSVEKLEQYYNKTILEIKSEFRDVISDQLVIQTMHSRITKDITASPAEVRSFFQAIHVDSLPYINAEVELAQILKIPVFNEADKSEVKERLTGFRNRILKGEDFAPLAILYSQDPGSAKKGGELGFMGRGELVPEFETVAFRLKPGEVSDILETKFGYHIIQLIERRGDQVNCRHILLKPAVSAESMNQVKTSLDSLKTVILKGELTFSEAAKKFSDDKETKFSGGLLVNQITGNSRFETDQLDPSLFFQIDKLKTGEISEPLITQTRENKQAYRIVILKTRTEPHRANLKDDYQRIQEATLTAKQEKMLAEWFNSKKKGTYLHIDNSYPDCEWVADWIK